MSRIGLTGRKILASISLTLPLVCLATGCGPTISTLTTVVSTEDLQTPATPAASKDQVPKGVSTTPNQKIDEKSVVDVVKGDVKGGEAASGGTPEDYLWQIPNSALIQDEPYNALLPKGFQNLLAFVPPSNPLTKGKVELGKQLYFEPRVSLNGTVSCATCHNPEKGWTDQLKTSTGIDGQVGGRNAPTVLNTAYGKRCSGTAAHLLWKGNRKGRRRIRSKWVSSRTSRLSTAFEASRDIASSFKRFSAPT